MLLWVYREREINQGIDQIQRITNNDINKRNT
jgi:hypothetical protein